MRSNLQFTVELNDGKHIVRFVQNNDRTVRFELLDKSAPRQQNGEMAIQAFAKEEREDLKRMLDILCK